MAQGRLDGGAAGKEDAGGAHYTHMGPPPSTLCLAPRCTQSGWTPLHTAAWEGHEKCVRVLVGAGAKKNAKHSVLRRPCSVPVASPELDQVGVA